jgi:hypothetical protein
MDNMCMKWQLSQGKVKTLESMVNGKGEIIFYGKEKELKWMFPPLLP